MSLVSWLRPAVLTLVGAGALALAPAPASAYSALYVFGDSLSDAGNVFSLSNGAVPPPPYVDGHFTNGRTWAEGLSVKLGLGQLMPSNTGGTDYAYGYATTSAAIPRSTPVPPGLPIPNVEQQVAAYGADHANRADPSALYAVWIGSNDVLNALAAFATGTLPPDQAAMRLQDVLTSEITAIGTLVGEGARHLLVGLLPDFGLTPALNSVAPAEGTFAAAVYNSALRQAIDSRFSGLDVNYLDTFTLLQAAVSNPSAYGFDDVTTACFTGATLCTNPDRHLFWDDLHPTREGHELIADLAFRTVSVAPVPLPGGIVLFGASLALVGAVSAARRSARRQPSAA